MTLSGMTLTTPGGPIIPPELKLWITGQNTIVDATGKNTLTIANAGVTIDTAVKQSGTSSMLFNPAAPGYITAPSSAENFALGADDFTAECWVRFNITPAGLLPFCQSQASLGGASSDKWWFAYESGNLKLGQHSTTNAVSAGWSPSSNTWYHVAVTRASGVVRLFVGGTIIATSSIFTGTNFEQNGFMVGAMTTPGYLPGNMNDFRFYKGFAKYTSNFTPV